MAASGGAEQRARRSRRGRLGSVRVRTTLAAVLIVGSALLTASVGLVWATRTAVTENVRDAAEIDAEAITDQLEAGSRPGDIALIDDDEVLIQILAANGTVERASPDV